VKARPPLGDSMKFLLAAMLTFFMAGTAFAQTAAPSTRVSRGYAYILCDAETNATGACDGAAGVGGDDRYVNVSRFDVFTVTFADTGTHDSTCEIHASDVYTAPAASYASRPENRINDTSLSDANDAISFSNFNFEYIWAVCTLANATDYTVHVTGSVGRGRDGR